MKLTHVYRATPIADKVPPAVTIVVDQPMPENLSIHGARAIFVDQGRMLADVLCTSLPGGTLDQLIAELLARRATLFVVPLFEDKS